jgi:hypothetical protein
MARGGARRGAGRKPASNRKVALLVRVDEELEQRIEGERGGKSKSSTIERLLRNALNRPQSDDESANRALGYIVEQAAMAASWQDLNWRNDPATRLALKMALPAIVDLLVPPEKSEKPHPLFTKPYVHAQAILMWVHNRLRERGDEYDTDLLELNPFLRNFPKAAAALNLKPKGE